MKWLGRRAEVERPQMRWSDDFKMTSGLNGIKTVQNQEIWKNMKETYTQRVENGRGMMMIIGKKKE